jgi:ParB family chromosome partitioning protein
LLKLPVLVQRKVAAGVLSAGHARAVLSVDDERMEYFANKAISEGLSVRALEELVAIDKPSKTKKVTVKPGARQDLFKSMAEKLSDSLNTPVKIQIAKAKGQIVIDFANLVDLKRILAEMGQSDAADD